MRKKIVVGAVLASLVLVASAGAIKSIEHIKLQAGDLIVDGYGGLKPIALPKHHNAPIVLIGGGKVSTVSGELPPILDNITFEFDRRGSVDTTGLEVCTYHELVATDVPEARHACPNAIVGEGHGTAIVKLPEQRSIPASTPITLFNGPKKHGFDTFLVHAHLEYPGPSTVLFSVVIEKIHKGVYGYRVEADIPELVNGYGHPASGTLRIGRKWTYHGKKHSYVNARCETGLLRARAEFGFKDGTILKGSFLKQCEVRE
jgi:hypothetical protein